jgi:hypothetical protein
VTSTAKKNDITPQMARDQMRALNGAYNTYNIRFSLANLTRTINDAWALGATADDLAMKQALRQGTYATLNIYFQTDLAGSILGKCTLPSSVGIVRRRRRRGARHGIRLRQRRVQRPGRHDAYRRRGGVQRGQDGGARDGPLARAAARLRCGTAARAMATSLPIRPSSAPAPMGVRRARPRIAVRGLRGWMRCIIIGIMAPMRVIPCLRLCSRRGWRVCGGCIGRGSRGLVRLALRGFWSSCFYIFCVFGEG